MLQGASHDTIYAAISFLRSFVSLSKEAADCADFFKIKPRIARILLDFSGKSLRPSRLCGFFQIKPRICLDFFSGHPTLS